MSIRRKFAIFVPVVILGAGAYYGAIARPLWQVHEEGFTRELTQSLPASSGPQSRNTDRAKILVGAFQVIGSVTGRVTKLKKKMANEVELVSNMLKVSSCLISSWNCVHVELFSDPRWLPASCPQLNVYGGN